MLLALYLYSPWQLGTVGLHLLWDWHQTESLSSLQHCCRPPSALNPWSLGQLIECNGVSRMISNTWRHIFKHARRAQKLRPLWYRSQTMEGTANLYYTRMGSVTELPPSKAIHIQDRVCVSSTLAALKGGQPRQHILPNLGAAE